MAYSPAIFITHVPRLALDLVQAADRVQRLFGKLTFQLKGCAHSLMSAEQADGTSQCVRFWSLLVIIDRTANDIDEFNEPWGIVGLRASRE